MFPPLQTEMMEGCRRFPRGMFDIYSSPSSRAGNIARAVAHGELSQQFREALQKHGIEAADPAVKPLDEKREVSFHAS